MVIGLILVSALAVFALGWLSDMLALRSRATPQQEEWGAIAWAVGAAALILAPTLVAVRRRSPVPRWLVIAFSGVVILALLQVGALVEFLWLAVFAPI